MLSMKATTEFGGAPIGMTSSPIKVDPSSAYGYRRASAVNSQLHLQMSGPLGSEAQPPLDHPEAGAQHQRNEQDQGRLSSLIAVSIEPIDLIEG